MKNVHEYQIKQDLLHAFGNSKKCSRLISGIKNVGDFNFMTNIVNSMMHLIPKFEQRFYGNVVPKTAKELGGEKSYFYKAESLESEINWVILGIKCHKNLIKEFVNTRKIFEHQLLLGLYDQALETLEKAENNLGVSIWLYESKLLVYEFMGCQDKAISLLSNINELKQSENGGFATLLLNYLSYRAAKDLSALKYDEDLFNNFKRNRTDFQKDFYNYCLFRLNYYIHYDIEDPSIPLIMEATNSLIDRYIVLVQVLQAVFIKGGCDKVIYSRSQYLFRLTGDSFLRPFIYAKDIKSSEDEYFNEYYIQIIDSYYKGNYQDVINKCKAYVKIDSSNFDILKFYSRSLLLVCNGFCPIYPDSSSPINQICQKVYNTISEKDNSTSLYNLYQLNKNLYGFTIANGLDYFIKEEKNSDKSIRLKLLSLTYFDPLFSLIFEDENDALLYLDNGLKHFGLSASIEHQIRRIKKEITPKSLIADYIAEIDNAKVLFYNENYNESYDSWVAILEKNRHCNPVIQVAIRFAFDCLIKLEKYQEAIVLFVNEYIKNPIGIKKVDVNPFMTLLKKRKYKNIKRIIELPIFVGLNATKDTDKSFVLQTFCEYYDVKIPSELFDEISYLNESKVETFFYVVVNEDTLRHYVHINSTQAILEEKQKILNHLVNMNSENTKLYKKKLDEVFEELIVYKGNKKIDESKIYANDQAIIKYELKDLEGLYERFVTHYKLLESGTSILFFDTSCLSYLNTGGSDAALLNANVKYTDNAIYQVAYSLYDSVRDKFLFSKFGLGTYLSTRIRHGVLEGELRSDLVRLNLVLNKENEKYVNNNYWDRTYGLDNKANLELYKILSAFSEGIDLLISSFKVDVLQIKVEESQKGLFDYNIAPETLSIEAIRIGSQAKNCEDFCQLIIKNLWEITERNLQNIRTYIKIELADAFYKLFDELMTRLSVVSYDHIHDDIIKVVTDARSNINQKLLKIEGWFYIQESKFDDFKLDELIKIVWDSTEKFYPKVHCKCALDLQGADITIKASYGIHFSDILRIFLTNMFKYSTSINSNIKEFKIEANIKESVLTFMFANDISCKEDMLNEKFKTLMKSQRKLQLEGGSGLVKVQKIVKYDLGCVENYVDIKAENKKCIANIGINLQNLVVYE